MAWDVLDSEHTPKVGPLGLADGLLQSLPTALTTGKARAFGGKGGGLGVLLSPSGNAPSGGGIQGAWHKKVVWQQGWQFQVIAFVAHHHLTAYAAQVVLLGPESQF